MGKIKDGKDGGDGRDKAVGGHVCKGTPGHEMLLRKHGKAFAGKLRRYWFEQRSRALARLEEMAIGERRTVHSKGVGDLLDWDDESDRLWDLAKPQLLGAMEAGGVELWKELELAQEFKLRPQAAVSYLDRRENMLRGTNDTIWEKLKGELQTGLDQGESYEQMADRLKAVYGEMSDYRAETVAQTEMNVALNTGRFEGMKDAGVGRKQWVTSGLENTRASHTASAERSREGIPLEEPFYNGLMYPGDPSGPPDETINCRCTMVAKE
jgi:hypothetical protein